MGLGSMSFWIKLTWPRCGQSTPQASLDHIRGCEWAAALLWLLLTGSALHRIGRSPAGALSSVPGTLTQRAVRTGTVVLVCVLGMPTSTDRGRPGPPRLPSHAAPFQGRGYQAGQVIAFCHRTVRFRDTSVRLPRSCPELPDGPVNWGLVASRVTVGGSCGEGSRCLSSTMAGRATARPPSAMVNRF
jgi:hypothetical protein